MLPETFSDILSTPMWGAFSLPLVVSRPTAFSRTKYSPALVASPRLPSKPG